MPRRDTSYDVDFSAIERLAARMKPRLAQHRLRTQVKLMSIIIRDCDPYVPFDSGTLSKTPMVASDKINGQIVYDTPYARRLYYGDSYTFSPDSHPQACARWFEKAKAVHCKEWEHAAKQLSKKEF